MDYHQRAKKGGEALKAKVDPDYYKFIGRLGGRRNYYNFFKSIGAEDAERYHDEVGGQRIMLEIWQPGAAPRRGKKPKKLWPPEQADCPICSTESQYIETRAIYFCPECLTEF
jgi:general stress protein YciG